MSVPSEHSMAQDATGLSDLSELATRLLEMSSSNAALSSRPQMAREPATLGNLPDEILEFITAYLDVLSIHSLRRSNNHFMGVCNDYLRRHCSVLYLHPTATSMKNLLEICSSGLYAPHITHLVLLGDPMWEEITKDSPGYRGQTQMAYWNDPTYFSRNGVRYKAWPWTYPLSSKTTRAPAPMPSPDLRVFRKKGTPKATKSTEDEGCVDADFGLQYKPVLDALAKLEQLRSLSYMTSPELAGLNAVSAQRIKSHAHATLTTGREMASRWIPFSSRLSDADVFYGILASPRLKFRFRDVALRDELPLFDGVRQQIPMCSLSDLNNPFSLAFSRLTSLDIGIGCGYCGSQNRMYRRLLRGSKSSLESLRIRLNPFLPRHAEDNKVKRIDLLFEEQISHLGYPELIIELPRLKHLEIIAVDSSSSPSLSPGRLGRWPRPPCLTLNREAVLKQYLGNLKTLRLRHVTILDHDIAGDGLVSTSSVPETIESDIQCIKRYATQLEHFEWIVPAFRHHPVCKSLSNTYYGLGVNPQCDRRFCGIYNCYSILPSTLEEMQRVAAELGVELYSETDCWNFGDYLQPEIEKRRGQEK